MSTARDERMTTMNSLDDLELELRKLPGVRPPASTSTTTCCSCSSTSATVDAPSSPCR